MTWRSGLKIVPADEEDARTDFSETFTAVDSESSVLSVRELSTQRGDGIFESIGVVDGHAQEVAAHLHRLAHSARLCDLPAPHLGQWRQAVLHVAAQAPPSGEVALKLILNRAAGQGATPTAWVTATDAADVTLLRENGVRVVTLDRGLDSGAAARAPWLLMGAKTLSYAVNMAALREARRRGADDALFVSSDGVVLEAPTASLILRFGDRFVTPAHDGGILPGTTQQSLFEHLEASGHPTSYETLAASRLAEADAAWLVSSVRLAVPVSAIDATPLPVDREATASFNHYLLRPRD